MIGNRRAAGAIAGVILLWGTLVCAETAQVEIDEVVVLDNDSVRVALLTFPPGSASGIHFNPEPELGIVLEGDLSLITPNGREVLRPGSVRWLSSMTPHDARNEGNRPVRLWALLFKRCS